MATAGSNVIIDRLQGLGTWSPRMLALPSFFLQSRQDVVNVTFLSGRCFDGKANSLNLIGTVKRTVGTEFIRTGPVGNHTYALCDMAVGDLQNLLRRASILRQFCTSCRQ